MPIRKRGDAFMADFRIGSRRFRVTFPTKEKAELFEAETKLKHLKGERLPEAVEDIRKVPTLRDLYDAVHARRWKGSKGEDSATRNALRVLELLGETTPVRDITLDKIDRLVQTLQSEKKANSTINRHLARLKTMLKHAHSRGWIQSMPQIEMMKEPPARLRYMSPAEETRMLGYFQYIGREDMRDLVVVMLDTGLRVSNACELTLDQYDGSRIVVSGTDAKGGKSYAIPATTRVKDVLQRAREDGRTRVFPRITSRHLARILWDKARDAMGLTDDKDFVPHCCRHTFCSRLVQRGVPITVVKELAGHSDITMTMRYAHLRGQDLDRAIEALEPAENEKPEKGLKIVSA